MTSSIVTLGGPQRRSRPGALLAHPLSDILGIDEARVVGLWAAVATDAPRFTFAASATGAVLVPAVAAYASATAVVAAAHDSVLSVTANTGSPGDMDVVVIGAPDVERIYAAREASAAPFNCLHNHSKGSIA